MFDKILVPLDGSALSERALEPALRLARPDEVLPLLPRTIILVHVAVPEVDGEYGWLLPAAASERSQRGISDYMDAVRQAVALSGVDVQTRIIPGDEASVISDTAATEQADLIVMSSHGYSGFMRWMLGSVTEKVLHSAPCPVLVARSGRPIRRILITLDGSPLAERALEPGLEIAGRLRADVILLQVVASGPLAGSRSVQYNWSRPYEEGRAESGISDAQDRYLETVVASYQPTGVDMKSVTLAGSAPGAILSYVEANDIDLVVMSTHGRTGLRRWLYGSVTAKVMRGAPCSTLIVRPPAEALH